MNQPSISSGSAYRPESAGPSAGWDFERVKFIALIVVAAVIYVGSVGVLIADSIKVELGNWVFAAIFASFFSSFLPVMACASKRYFKYGGFFLPLAGVLVWTEIFLINLHPKSGWDFFYLAFVAMALASAIREFRRLRKSEKELPLASQQDAGGQI